MANDTTALAEAIRATRDAVASMETAMNYRTAGRAADATVALLAALSGVPERLAALEVVVAHRKVRRAMSALEGEEGTLDLEDALAALGASRKGGGGGTD